MGRAAFAASDSDSTPKFDARLPATLCGDMANLTSDQLEEIREAFKLFDTDDSGTIDSDGAFFRNFFPSLSVTCTSPPPC